MDAERPTFGEDESTIQILRFSGILSSHLRAVSRLFRRAWAEPATWQGASVVWPDAPPAGVEFLYRHALPALVRAAALDTYAERYS